MILSRGLNKSHGTTKGTTQSWSAAMVFRSSARWRDGSNAAGVVRRGFSEVDAFIARIFGTKTLQQHVKEAMVSKIKTTTPPASAKTSKIAEPKRRPTNAFAAPTAATIIKRLRVKGSFITATFSVRQVPMAQLWSRGSMPFSFKGMGFNRRVTHLDDRIGVDHSHVEHPQIR